MNGAWKPKVFSDSVSRWVATELANGGDGGDDWCESMSLRSEHELGTPVPIKTIKAHVFAIRKRMKEASIGGKSDG